MRVRTAEFDRTLRQYMDLSKRDWAQVFNTKGFFIARRATVDTKKADPAEIRKLRERRVIGTGSKNGKAVKLRDPLATTRAALILHTRRRAQGEKRLGLGLGGEAAVMAVQHGRVALVAEPHGNPPRLVQERHGVRGERVAETILGPDFDPGRELAVVDERAAGDGRHGGGRVASIPAAPRRRTPHRSMRTRSERLTLSS